MSILRNITPDAVRGKRISHLLCSVAVRGLIIASALGAASVSVQAQVPTVTNVAIVGGINSVKGGESFQIEVSVSGLSGSLAIKVYSDDITAVPVSGALHSLTMSTQKLTMPTRPVASDTMVELHVLSSSGLKTVGLTVLAPDVASVVLSPDVSVGGLVLATINFDGALPAGGAEVALSQLPDGVVNLPPPIMVAGGALSVELPIVVPAVGVPTSVSISALMLGSSASAPLELLAAELTSFTLLSPEPGDVYGGNELDFQMTLDMPAPPEGVSVALSSVPSNILPLQLLTVPGGESALQVTALTPIVTSNTNVTFKATLNDVTFDLPLTLRRAAVQELVALPDPVRGGLSTMLTVELTAPAPLGGANVALSSGNPGVLSVPPSLQVPQGATSAMTMLNSTLVLTDTPVLLTATLSGVMAQHGVTVIPPRKGDADGDNAIELTDWAEFAECLSGPSGSPSAACVTLFDFTGNGKVALADAASMLNKFTGDEDGIVPPAPEVVVDPTVVPVIDELPSFDGVTPRPVAALADADGRQAEFVQNEIILVTNSTSELNAFLNQWGGTVLKTFDPSVFNLTGPVQHLIRVDPMMASAANLGSRLGAIEPGGGMLRFSNDEGMHLLAVATAGHLDGGMVGVNWVARSDTFLDRTSTEAPTGPGGYVPNAFNWDTFAEASVQGIGVGEAWRALELAGKLAIKIAVLDMGFAPDADFPPGVTYISNVPFILDPRNQDNLVDCSGGNPCPWHGTNVMHTAIGLADNNYGAAGVAGPVGEGVAVFTFGDMFSGVTAVSQARFVGARILNMSYGVGLPLGTGWTAAPFEIATEAVHLSGALLFASAGNAGENVDSDECLCIPFVGCACVETTKHTPCENPGVICVGGLQSNSKKRAANSNYGSEDVDMFAPFTVYVGPDPATPAVHSVNGTSFSSPFAAGVAGLIWAANPGLSQNSVRDILFDTAQSSPDSRVPRYVDAYEGVIGALPSAPPEVDILFPTPGLTFSINTTVYFSGVSWDREDGSPLITWRSHRVAGVLGTGMTISRNDLALGQHVITATVTDSSGISLSDTVTISIVNNPPVVSIFEPVTGQSYCAGEAIILRGASFDPNYPSGNLPDGSLVWTSNVQGVLGAGANTATALVTPGSHTITLTGTDDMGLVDSEAVTVTVSGPPCDPIALAITNPPSDVIVFTNGVDAMGRGYYEVNLQALAFDPQDGLLTDVTWTTNRTDLQPAALGTGSSVVVRLYWSNCAELFTTHTVTVTATDSQGNVRTRVRLITVNTIC